MDSIVTALGLVGVGIVLLAFGLVSSGRIAASNARYQLMNILGTVGVLLSLIAQWNLSSFILNAAWLVIGIVGLIRITRRRTA